MAATGKRYKSEQIVNMLREIDVMAANGKSSPEACKQIALGEGVTQILKNYCDFEFRQNLRVSK